jgi:flagellin
MSVSLINNLGSLASQTRLNATGNKLNATIQRLSSGLRINSSGDDAAGLAIANKYRSDISILSQGIRNANDGLSTLQIIDGGLNTISGLLDRAATLSTQSASGTFSGDRDILQDEFTKVLDEITRQAENIGLVSGGTYNNELSVIIGGGTDTYAATGSNAGVTIDLSGSTNRVDSTSLGLSNLNIGVGTGNVTGDNALTTLTAAETLTFQYVDSGGALASTTVTLAAGASAAQVVDAINANATLSEYGIEASLDSSNKLVLSSAKLFTVSSSLADTAGQTGIGGSGASANDIAISSAVNYVSKAVTAGANAATTQTLSFTGEEIGYENSSYDVTFTAAASAANGATAAANAVNNDLTLRSKGVYAIVDKADSSNIRFVSLKDFNLAISSSTGAVAANTNIDSLQSPTAATAGTLTGGVSGAKEALDALATAIANLGTVQGVVGSGQNRLQQAVDLATSQITNFQSAESRIRDADVTAEASSLARLSVLQQAGVAALAQANQSSQAVLSLLRG